jgi:hypothetical protein
LGTSVELGAKQVWEGFNGDVGHYLAKPTAIHMFVMMDLIVYL